jgi:alkanesulfonate monooxygenase SsuD/methylene tetrahydromethanopterin reductase-like flavin-dependent oxidoreductase (luciferase family)
MRFRAAGFDWARHKRRSRRRRLSRSQIHEAPLTRLKETIKIVRLLLAGERVDFDGECFKLARFKLGFKPVRSELPIYVAALTPKSLRQLGELADGWLPTHWPGDKLHEGIVHIRAGAESIARDPDQIEIAPFVNVVVSRDVAKARDRARLPLAYYIGGMGDFYHASLARLGFEKEADRVRDLWQAGRPREAIKAVTDELVDAVAVCGPIEDCGARLDELYLNGATLPIVSIPEKGSTSEKCRVIEALAILPAR